MDRKDKGSLLVLLVFCLVFGAFVIGPWLSGARGAEPGLTPGAVHSVALVGSKAKVHSANRQLHRALKKCSHRQTRHARKHCRHKARGWRNARLRYATWAYLWTPLGQPMANGSIAASRWNPCAGPITYSVDYAGAPTQDHRTPQQDVAEAIRQVSAATGLSFQPVASSGQLTVHWAPVPTEDDALERTTTSDLVGADGTAQTIQADVTMGTQVDTGADRLNLLLHELGHAMGLDHVKDGREVMFGGAGTQDTYARGDLAGLHALGAAAGCWRVR